MNCLECLDCKKGIAVTRVEGEQLCLPCSVAADAPAALSSRRCRICKTQLPTSRYYHCSACQPDLDVPPSPVLLEMLSQGEDIYETE